MPTNTAKFLCRQQTRQNFCDSVDFEAEFFDLCFSSEWYMWNCRRNTFDAKKKRICWQNCQGGNLRFFKGSVLTLLYAIDNKKFQWKIGFLSHFRQKYKMVCFCGGFPKFLWDNCWKLYFECVVMVIYCPNCKRYKIRSYVVCKFEKKWIRYMFIQEGGMGGDGTLQLDCVSTHLNLTIINFTYVVLK